MDRRLGEEVVRELWSPRIVGWTLYVCVNGLISIGGDVSIGKSRDVVGSMGIVA